MATRQVKRLTARRVDTETRPGRHADGDGLYLEIEPSGSKRWTLRIMIAKRRRDIGLGGVRDVSLAQAREEVAKLRRMARAGLDPVAERRKAKISIPSFRNAALAMHREHGPTWKNDKHAAQWLVSLERHVFPRLGDVPVNQLDGPIIRDVLLPIWLEIPETARRIRQRIGAVLDWAASKGLREGDNPVRSITKGMPRQPKDKGHFSALDYREAPSFIERLRKSHSSPTARLAFEWLVLTATRTSETLHAQWSEIDADQKTWTIPAERMKAGRPHIIPLTKRCLEILREVKQSHSGERDFVFENAPGRPFSNMVFLKMLASMDMRNKATAHGFRSSFRDWAAETTGFPSDVVEMALAHSIRNKTEAAYRRGDLLEKRRELMSAWERHCCSMGDNVIALSRKISKGNSRSMTERE